MKKKFFSELINGNEVDIRQLMLAVAILIEMVYRITIHNFSK